MAIRQLKKKTTAERREALVKELMIICSVLAAFPLPERCSIRKGGIADSTADRSLFMVDEQRCRMEAVEGGAGCNKAECISHAMKPQKLERTEESGEAGEVLQI